MLMTKYIKDPDSFIDALRRYHETPETARGHLANAMVDAIIGKHVDLALVRRQLLDGGHAELYDTLERLMDIVQPYLEEIGDNE